MQSHEGLHAPSPVAGPAATPVTASPMSPIGIATPLVKPSSAASASMTTRDMRRGSSSGPYKGDRINAAIHEPSIQASRHFAALLQRLPEGTVAEKQSNNDLALYNTSESRGYAHGGDRIELARAPKYYGSQYGGKDYYSAKHRRNHQVEMPSLNQLATMLNSVNARTDTCVTDNDYAIALYRLLDQGYNLHARMSQEPEETEVTLKIRKKLATLDGEASSLEDANAIIKKQRLEIAFLREEIDRLKTIPAGLHGIRAAVRRLRATQADLRQSVKFQNLDSQDLIVQFAKSYKTFSGIDVLSDARTLQAQLAAKDGGNDGGIGGGGTGGLSVVKQQELSKEMQAYQKEADPFRDGKTTMTTALQAVVEHVTAIVARTPLVADPVWETIKWNADEHDTADNLKKKKTIPSLQNLGKTVGVQPTTELPQNLQHVVGFNRVTPELGHVRNAVTACKQVSTLFTLVQTLCKIRLDLQTELEEAKTQIIQMHQDLKEAEVKGGKSGRSGGGSGAASAGAGGGGGGGGDRKSIAAVVQRTQENGRAKIRELSRFAAPATPTGPNHDPTNIDEDDGIGSTSPAAGGGLSVADIVTNFGIAPVGGGGRGSRASTAAGTRHAAAAAAADENFDSPRGGSSKSASTGRGGAKAPIPKSGGKSVGGLTAGSTAISRTPSSNPAAAGGRGGAMGKKTDAPSARVSRTVSIAEPPASLAPSRSTSLAGTPTSRSLGEDPNAASADGGVNGTAEDKPPKTEAELEEERLAAYVNQWNPKGTTSASSNSNAAIRASLGGGAFGVSKADMETQTDPPVSPTHGLGGGGGFGGGVGLFGNARPPSAGFNDDQQYNYDGIHTNERAGTAKPRGGGGIIGGGYDDGDGPLSGSHRSTAASGLVSTPTSARGAALAAHQGGGGLSSVGSSAIAMTSPRQRNNLAIPTEDKEVMTLSIEALIEAEVERRLRSLGFINEDGEMVASGGAGGTNSRGGSGGKARRSKKSRGSAKRSKSSRSHDGRGRERSGTEEGGNDDIPFSDANDEAYPEGEGRSRRRRRHRTKSGRSKDRSRRSGSKVGGEADGPSAVGTASDQKESGTAADGTHNDPTQTTSATGDGSQMPPPRSGKSSRRNRRGKSRGDGSGDGTAAAGGDDDATNNRSFSSNGSRSCSSRSDLSYSDDDCSSSDYYSSSSSEEELFVVTEEDILLEMGWVKNEFGQIMNPSTNAQITKFEVTKARRRMEEEERNHAMRRARRRSQQLSANGGGEGRPATGTGGSGTNAGGGGGGGSSSSADLLLLQQLRAGSATPSRTGGAPSSRLGSARTPTHHELPQSELSGPTSPLPPYQRLPPLAPLSPITLTAVQRRQQDGTAAGGGGLGSRMGSRGGSATSSIGNGLMNTPPEESLQQAMGMMRGLRGMMGSAGTNSSVGAGGGVGGESVATTSDKGGASLDALAAMQQRVLDAKKRESILSLKARRSKMDARPTVTVSANAAMMEGGADGAIGGGANDANGDQRALALNEARQMLCALQGNSSANPFARGNYGVRTSHQLVFNPVVQVASPPRNALMGPDGQPLKRIGNAL